VEEVGSAVSTVKPGRCNPRASFVAGVALAVTAATPPMTPMTPAGVGLKSASKPLQPEPILTLRPYRTHDRRNHADSTEAAYREEPA
jgi:hypothetical protein